MVVRGDQIATAQGHHAQEPVDGTAAAVLGPAGLHLPGGAEQVSCLVDSVAAPKQFGQRHNRGERRGPSTRSFRQVDHVAAEPFRGGQLATVEQADPVPGQRADEQLGLVGATPLSVILRPAPPDCDSPQNLGEKLRLASELELERVAFYHYGLMRLDALDLIREAATT